MPTPVIMPLTEVCDRYVIAKLKAERLRGEIAAAELERQVAFYAAGIDFSNEALLELLDQLYEVNATQWDLEKEIFRGETDDMPLDEIGRRALKIRNSNRRRCAIKNQIAKLTGSGFHEEKADYADGSTA